MCGAESREMLPYEAEHNTVKGWLLLLAIHWEGTGREEAKGAVPRYRAEGSRDSLTQTRSQDSSLPGSRFFSPTLASGEGTGKKAPRWHMGFSETSLRQARPSLL